MSFFESYKCFTSGIFWFWSNLIKSRLHFVEKILFLRFLRSLLTTYMYFDNLESGKRNYSFGKILEEVLNFRSKICTNRGIFMSPTGGGTIILRGHPSQSTFISHLVEYWSSPGNGTCDLLLSGQALYQLS